jgi:VanZ family protein
VTSRLPSKDKPLAPQQKIPWKILLLSGFWTAVFIATHLPRVPRVVGKVSDKTLHFAAFAILGFLLSWVLASRHKNVWRHAFFVLLIIAIYGAIDELLQIPVGRHCDFRDWIADMVGATAGLLLFHGGCALKRRYYIPA